MRFRKWLAIAVAMLQCTQARCACVLAKSQHQHLAGISSAGIALPHGVHRRQVAPCVGRTLLRSLSFRWLTMRCRQPIEKSDLHSGVVLPHLPGEIFSAVVNKFESF